jgi:hypothetical protein
MACRGIRGRTLVGAAMAAAAVAAPPLIVAKGGSAVLARERCSAGDQRAVLWGWCGGAPWGPPPIASGPALWSARWRS